jgi:hypothetical protein
MSILTNSDFRTISNHTIAEVRQNLITNQKGLFAMKNFIPEETIQDFSASEILSAPTYLTVQVANDKHILLDPQFLQYINHSCDPNVFFDTTMMKVIALKPIHSGEEFSFFYPSAEWDMAQPFTCHCGSKNCLKEIKGAAYLSKEETMHYRLTRFIQQQLHDRKIRERA